MKDKKILIVEDELLISSYIEQMVRNLGYQVTEIVDSGDQAIESVQKNPCDLVLMDIRLKGNINGIQAASRIWNLYSIPIVYLTAYADEDTVALAGSTEPFGYLLKPFDEKELLVAIEIAFYKHQIENEIKLQRRWFKAILSSITDGVISTDRDGRINFINPIGEKLLGTDLGQVVGKKLEEVFQVQIGKTGKNFGLNLETIGPADFSLNQDFYLVRGMEKIPVELGHSFVKGDFDQIVGSVVVFRDITQRKIQEEQLNFMAIHDSLTGLPNRLLFNDRLKMNLEQAKRKKLKTGMMMLDLDFFKRINDTYGHSFGDQVLIESGQRLNQLIRKSDTVARFGGDEFAVLLGEMQSALSGIQVAERIIQAFRQPFSVEGREVVCTVSLGLAIFPEAAEEPEELIKKADIALYKAKEAGRNCFQLFESKNVQK